MPLNALLSRPRPLTLGALLPLLLLATGCGGRGDVAGKVSLDGKPLPAGTIIFQDSKKHAVSAEIKDGEYAATGVPTGDVKVAVDTTSLKGRAEMLVGGVKLSDQEAAARAQQAKEMLAKYRPIPTKYADPEKSGLTTKVNTGSNQYDVTLTSK